MMPATSIVRSCLFHTAAATVWCCSTLMAAAQPPAASAPPTVETCRGLADRIARLECFDTVFNVVPPKPAQDAPAFPVDQTPPAPGPVRMLAQQQEAGRGPEQRGWITRIRPWRENMFFSQDNFREIRGSSANQEPEGTVNRHQWTDENVDVFLTQREADIAADGANKPLADKALLVAACENDITTLYVVLPKPVNDPRTRLTLSSDRGTEFSVRWRDVEQGNVISAGRGLESIDFLKSLASFRRIQLQLRDDREARAFVFDIEDLAARLSPLRTACHW